MFPVSLDLAILSVMLVGNGPKTVRRLALLEECGARHLRIFADNPNDELVIKAGKRLIKHLPKEKDLAGIHIVMIVDMEECAAAKLAQLARDRNILVNVEDKKPYCDFHFPSFIKRGDLLLAVSSGGKSPTLSRAIKNWLAGLFDESWGDKLDMLAAKREEWQAQGLGYNEITQKSEGWITAEQWLKKE